MRGDEFYGEQVNRKELCLRVKPISSYRANILRKTRMKNNAEVIRCTIQNKLVD